MKKGLFYLLSVLALVFTPILITNAAIYNPSVTTTYSDLGVVNGFNNPDFGFLSSMGLVPDSSTDWVFGENIDVSGDEEVWDGGGDYTYSADATADIVSIACAAGMTLSATITGLTVDGTYNVQSATCNGTTRVALTTALWRVLKVENNSATDASGDIIVYTGTGAKPTILDTTIRAYLWQANNRTLTSFYTVPDGYVGWIPRAFTKITRKGTAGEADVLLRFRKYGKQFQTYDRANLDQLYRNTPFAGPMVYPFVLPGKTDIKCEIDTDSTGDGFGIGCGYEIMIIKESKFPTSFLNAIGQP